MSRKKKNRRVRKTPDEILLRYCSKLNEDDQVDPREYFRANQPKFDRKTMQLCKQVGNTLSQVFGELSDEVLQGLNLVAVRPAPSASQLLVIVQMDQVTSEQNSVAEVRERLTLAEGNLRIEIARAIHRKKTPRLLFEVIDFQTGLQVTD